MRRRARVFAVNFQAVAVSPRVLYHLSKSKKGLSNGNR